jgi:hypothetical protein
MSLSSSRNTRVVVEHLVQQAALVGAIDSREHAEGAGPSYNSSIADR